MGSLPAADNAPLSNNRTSPLSNPEALDPSDMGTIALFITVFILLCIFALIFVCYRAGRDSRQQQEEQDEEAGMMRRANIVLSIVPNSAAAAALTARAQSHSSQRSHAAYNKMPTPPTIIRNLPCMVWDKPPRASTSKNASEDDSTDNDEGLCVICCCDYVAGEQIKLLPCLHMYHQLCIDAWLERSHLCPVCQADVVRAAGLSAAVGDWSIHTQQAVNVISGVHTQPAPPPPQQNSSTNTPPPPQQPSTPDPSLGHAPTSLPVSSPTSPAPAAPAAADGQRVSTGSSGHSTDAIALVLTHEPASGSSSTCLGRQDGSTVVHQHAQQQQQQQQQQQLRPPLPAAAPAGVSFAHLTQPEAAAVAAAAAAAFGGAAGPGTPAGHAHRV